MRTSAVALVIFLAGCGASSATTVRPSERVSVFTHCGFYEVVFDGATWTPDSVERGAYPEGTDPIATPGLLTRHGDRALFEADSGLEVWFTLAPPDLPPPPPCD